MTSRSKSVVVGVDGSATALLAVRWAARSAARDEVSLRLVHAYQLPAGIPSGVTEEQSMLNVLRRQGRHWLDRARALAVSTVPGLDVDTELAAMSTITGLIHESETGSLLVVGNRGHSVLTGLLLGSTSLAMAGHARCPVVLVRNGADGSPRTGPVVVGVDGTDASEAALEFAFGEAAAARTSLVVVHAYPESVFEEALAADDVAMNWTLQRELAEVALAERLAGWEGKYPQVHVEREVVHDRATRALRRRAQTARLLVVGRRGQGGFRGFVLGSTSLQLLHQVSCPVAVVRKEPTS
jgi:nucleotide-binding universal stress UspA family protein